MRDKDLRKTPRTTPETAPGGGDHHHDHGPEAAGEPGCTLRSLPPRLAAAAARTATRINPGNSPYLSMMHAVAADVMEPLRLAVMTTKYWGPQPRELPVSFMDGAEPALRAKIISHMNAWSRTAGITFRETGGVGAVRIAREPSGYWSYLGTDVLHIPASRQTMNLQGFTLGTSEAEYRRVVRHETGHTLGFPHEHMRRALVERIDPQKAYDYFLRRYGWDRAMVDSQVLKSLDEGSLLATPPDQDSIMAYQLPGSITFDGLPIRGGADINATDYAFAGKIYPRPGAAAAPLTLAKATGDDWPETEDVTDAEVEERLAA